MVVVGRPWLAPVGCFFIGVCCFCIGVRLSYKNVAPQQARAKFRSDYVKQRLHRLFDRQGQGQEGEEN